MKKKTLLLSTFIMFVLLFPFNVYAEHSHTSDCYNNAELHTCIGDAQNGGACFSVPIYHSHTNDCYSHTCSGNNIDAQHTEMPRCLSCGGMFYKTNFICLDCGASLEFNYCTTPDCVNYGTSSEQYDKISHNSLSDEKAIYYGNVICGKSETTIEYYANSCMKENGKFYSNSGEIAKPECGTVAVSWKAENENPNGKNISTKVVITYLDGHKSTIEASYSNIGDIDFNSTYTNYPLTLYFPVRTAVNNVEQEQCITVYYNNVGVEDEVIIEEEPKDNEIKNEIETPKETTKPKEENNDDAVVEKEPVQEDKKENNENVIEKEDKIEKEDGVDLNTNLESDLDTPTTEQDNSLVVGILISAIVCLIFTIGLTLYIVFRK